MAQSMRKIPQKGSDLRLKYQLMSLLKLPMLAMLFSVRKIILKYSPRLLFCIYFMFSFSLLGITCSTYTRSGSSALPNNSFSFTYSIEA